MMNGEFLAYPLIFLIIIVLIIKLWEKTKELKEKNLRLIQFYLDRKFLYKIISESLSINSEEPLNFEIINKIKEYFQLEEVKILKYSSLEENENLASPFKDKLKSIITAYYKQKETALKNSYLVLDSVRIADDNYRLYIYFPCKKTIAKIMKILFMSKQRMSLQVLAMMKC